MSFLTDKALEKLGEAITKLEKEGPKALEKFESQGFDKALTEIEKFSKANAGALGIPDAKAVEVLTILKGTKQPFMRLSQVEFAAMISHWGNQRSAEAKRIYLAQNATYAERRKAMQAAGDAVFNAQKEREESWQEVAEIFKVIGTVGLKFLAAALLPSVSGLIGKL